MSPPVLSLDDDYESWLLQFDSYCELKAIGHETKDGQKDYLASIKKSALPSALDQTLLTSVKEKLKDGRSTYSSSLDAIKSAWLRLSRPEDPLKELQNLSFVQPNEVEDCRVRMLKLANYLQMSDKAVAQQLIAASPTSLRVTISAKFVDQNPSSAEVSDFVSKLPPVENKVYAISGNSARWRTESRPGRRVNYCSVCRKEGHSTIYCKDIICHKCGGKGHVAKNCYRQQKNPNE